MITISDLDYTLLDSSRFKKECLAPFFDMTARAWEDQYEQNFKKPRINYSPRKQLERLSLSDDEITDRLAELKKYLNQEFNRFLFPRVEETLDYLKAKSEKLILASFGDLEWQRLKVDCMRVNQQTATQYFDQIILEDKDKAGNEAIRSLKGREVLLINDKYNESQELLKTFGESARLYLVKGPYSDGEQGAHDDLSEIKKFLEPEFIKEHKPFRRVA